MFDLGFWELLFVGVIALIVLGPERLPVAARTVGRWVGQARAYTRSLSSELNREVHIREAREQLKSAEGEIRSGFQSADREMRALAEGEAEPAAAATAAGADPETDQPPASVEQSDAEPGQGSDGGTSPAPGGTAPEDDNRKP